MPRRLKEQWKKVCEEARRHRSRTKESKQIKNIDCETAKEQEKVQQTDFNAEKQNTLP